MENKLVSLSVSYSEFIDKMENSHPECEAILSDLAVSSLCKNGFGNNIINTILTCALLVWVVAAIVGTIFYSTWFLTLLLIIPTHCRIAHKSNVRSVWNELLGKGKLPYALREEIYYHLIFQYELVSLKWIQTKPNNALSNLSKDDDDDDDFVDLTDLYNSLERELEKIAIRQENEDINEVKISVKTENYSEHNPDGSIRRLGHYDVIDYTKHDMDVEGQEAKTLQEFEKFAKRFGLHRDPELYDKIKSKLETIDYDDWRYSHGEFNPPDLIVCAVIMEMIEEEVEI